MPNFSPENNSTNILDKLDKNKKINKLLDKNNIDEGEPIWASNLVTFSEDKVIIHSSEFDEQINELQKEAESDNNDQKRIEELEKLRENKKEVIEAIKKFFENKGYTVTVEE